MNFRLFETAIALCIALGLASLGNLVLARRSRNIFAWNESFIVGAGLAATLLFPLSLLFRRSALLVTLAIVVAAAVAGIARLFVGWVRKGDLAPDEFGQPQRPFRSLTRVELWCLVLIVSATAAFVLLNLRAGLAWDGFQIWATKAQALYIQGALGRDTIPETGFLGRMVNYPQLIPLYEAMLTVLRSGPKGEFDFAALKPVFSVFYVSLLLSTYRAARAILTRPLALASVALLAALPAISFKFENIGGYADMPMAAVAAATVAAGLRLQEQAGASDMALAWLVGAMLMVKSEGVVLLGVTALTLIIVGASFGAPVFLKRLAAARAAILLAVLFVVLRVAYLRWIGFKDMEFALLSWENAWRAVGLIWPVVLNCLRSLIDFANWVFFWPLFFLLGAVALVKGRRAEQGIVLAVALGILAYAGIYLFTNWDVAIHIQNSYSRLLSHLAPVAAIAIICGYQIVRNSMDSGRLGSVRPRV